MSIITLHMKVIVDRTYFQDSCRSNFSNLFVRSNKIYTKNFAFQINSWNNFYFNQAYFDIISKYIYEYLEVTYAIKPWFNEFVFYDTINILMII